MPWRLLGSLAAGVLAGTALAASASAAWVVIVDPSGSQRFQSIQAAVDAAHDGDILLVAPGSDPGFTIDHKSLSIFALEPGTVDVWSAVVKNLAAHQMVVLSGLAHSAWEQPGLWVTDCAGHVRLQDLTHLEPLQLTNSSRVVVVRSSFEGWMGWCSDYPPYSCGDGYPSVTAVDSDAGFYDCSFRGGEGGGDCGEYDICPTGAGGPALSVSANSGSRWVFASGSSLQGGNGGCTNLCCSGPGGPAVWVGSNGTALMLGSSYAGGYSVGFPPICQSNQAGAVSTSGSGVFSDFNLPARKLASIATVIGHGPLTFDVAAPTGDRVFFARSWRPGFFGSFKANGVWAVPFPALLTFTPLGIVPPAGQLSLSVPIAALPSNLAAQLFIYQLVDLTPTGMLVLGTPHHLLQLNPDVGPDCNGNGVQDWVDILEGTSADANHDLIPDGC